MKEKPELRPCPFCGGKAWIINFPLSNTYEVRCIDCNMASWALLTRRGKYDTAEEAWAEFDRKYGGNDFAASNHRVMEARVTTVYKKVER